MHHPPALQSHVTYLAERAMTRHAIAERATTARTPPGGPAAASLSATAERIAARLREHFDPATLPVQQVLGLAEEAGEFTAAYRRWAGLARHPGPWHDVEAELADVVLCAYVTANVLGIDLDAAWRAKAQTVFTRGWREPSPVA